MPIPLRMEIDSDLKKALSGTLDPHQNLLTAKKVVCKHFPDADLAPVEIVKADTVSVDGRAYNRAVHSQYRLWLHWPGCHGECMTVCPSTMSPSTMKMIGLCASKKMGASVSTVLVRLAEQAQQAHWPLKEDLLKNRSFKVLRDFVLKNGIVGVTFPPKKNSGQDSFLYLRLVHARYTSPPILRAIPKRMSANELVAYILSTGDLPTPGKAAEIDRQLASTRETGPAWSEDRHER